MSDGMYPESGELRELALAALAGCGNTGGTTATTEQQANRTYMSQVNAIMEKLDGKLGVFVDAVSRNDLVNMRTQADDALKTLNELADIEVPEALADIHKKYVDGSKKLSEALNGYVVLYTDMASGAIDQVSYADRLAEIQTLYDEGVKLLEEGDKLAADKS